MTVRIRPEAESDIAAAYAYYEEASEGLGAEFLRAVEATLAIVERTPQLYAVVHREARRALLRRFPYGIFYSQAGEFRWTRAESVESRMAL